MTASTLPDDSPGPSCPTGPGPTGLRTAGREEPFGIGDRQPRLTWRNAAESAVSGYQVRLGRCGRADGDELVWDSGIVAGENAISTVYAGAPLVSRTGYRWHVRTFDADGTATDWSRPADFETGQLRSGDWTATWIAAPLAAGDDRRARYFRTDVVVPDAVVRGRAYVSALGWYRLFINGVDLTGPALVPRWTPLGQYVEYQVYDITDAIRAGVNTIGVVVADGRYRGTLGILGRRANYGRQLGVIAQFDCELADGRRFDFGSDLSWRVGEGRIWSADPKTGERVDLRISGDDWLKEGGRAVNEKPVQLHGEPPAMLIAEEVGRVEAVERLPGAVKRAADGSQLVDFGQNFAGVARIRLAGPAGRNVVLQYSEVLTPEGELDTSYLLGQSSGRQWFQRDEVVLAGEAVDYTPWFTIHGFRYLSVRGLDKELSSADVEGIVLSTQMDSISEFHASDPRLEQLWRNVVWSMRSNFTDTATDCPTRERSGWTGDVQVFSPTALQLAECEPFLTRYLRNVAAEQGADGTVPPVIPAEDLPGHSRNRLLRRASTSVGWGDVSVMLPWNIYRYRGDTEVLRHQYSSAKAWVDQLARRAAGRTRITRRLARRGRAGGTVDERYILDTGYHWGEWLRPGTSMPHAAARNVVCSPAVIATAYLAHSAGLLGQIARIVDRPGDAARYTQLAADVRRAWHAAFVSEGGARIGRDKQDDYVRALAFGLLNGAGERERALGRLVELVEQAGYHLGTGFLSTPMLLTTLADEGRPDIAYRLLMQDTSPSWLAQVARGATTTWETWEGYDSRGRAHESHNHYAFGSVVQFLHERVVGLQPLEPGYRRIRVAPIIGGGLTSASVSIDTPYGPAAAAWVVRGGTAELTITVAPGTSAEVIWGELRTEAGPGTHRFAAPAPRGLDN